MKEQLHTAQESRAQKQDREREPGPAPGVQASRLPARQWARLLGRANGLPELPLPLLEELAQGVGNSNLSDLLRQGGADEPVTYTPDTLSFGEARPGTNHIQTAPPPLFPFAGWPEGGGPWTRPVRPGSVKESG